MYPTDHIHMASVAPVMSSVAQETENVSGAAPSQGLWHVVVSLSFSNLEQFFRSCLPIVTLPFLEKNKLVLLQNGSRFGFVGYFPLRCRLLVFLSRIPWKWCHVLLVCHAKGPVTSILCKFYLAKVAPASSLHYQLLFSSLSSKPVL